MIDQAVILCGGYGTRLLPITRSLPKPMVKVESKPFLEHLILQCKLNGIKNFLILCGYKKEKIKQYFKNGKKLDVNISYHENNPNIKTLKRILDAKKYLKKNFLLLYADNYSSLNIIDLYRCYKKNKTPLIISLCEKKKGNILIDSKNGIIKKYLKSRSFKSKFVEIGYMIFSKKILNEFKNDKNSSLKNLLQKCSQRKKVSYYFNDTGYLSISDKKRLNLTRNYFKKKILLLDRDGVINLKNPKHRYVKNVHELKINLSFLNKYKNLLKKNKIICISNQAGISTGDIKERNLKEINNKIKKFYKKNKVDILDFFISKHHFTSNHLDRKPGHGLFLKAAKKHKFVLDRSVYIGDDLRDILASYNAKTKCIYTGIQKINKNNKKKFQYTLINN